MAISPFKIFTPGEILTASDLNASFTQVTSNGEDLGWPATKAKDLNGFALTLDADADSSFAAGTDDIATLTLQGVAQFIFDGDVASPVNGFRFTGSATGVAPEILAQGSDTNISARLSAKGTGDIEMGAGGTETDILVLPGGSETNIDLRFAGKGTGVVAMGDALLEWPDADGSANEALLTNGSGVLSFGGATVVTGDRLTFQQTTPSALFTKDTGSQDDMAFRFTTGAATTSTAGNTFSINFANRAASNVGLSEVQTGPHDHTGTAPTDLNGTGGAAGNTVVNSNSAADSTATLTIANAGSGSNHSHTLDMSVDYHSLTIGEVT